MPGEGHHREMRYFSCHLMSMAYLLLALALGNQAVSIVAELFEANDGFILSATRFPLQAV